MSTVPVGKHCILEITGCPFDILNDAKHIASVLEHAAHAARSTLLNLRMHAFQPFGVTGLALLAESHISIHTWPEHSYAAIDVFTCGAHTDPEGACRYLVEHLGAREHSLVTLDRGAAFSHAPAPHALHAQHIQKDPAPCLVR